MHGEYNLIKNLDLNQCRSFWAERVVLKIDTNLRKN